MTRETKRATFAEIKRVRILRTQGLTYGQCAKRMGETRGRIAGIIRRFVRGGALRTTVRQRYEESRWA